MDKLYFQTYKQRLVHPDPHSENFLYDDKDNQIYWIDTDDEIKIKEDKDGFVDLGIARHLISQTAKDFESLTSEDISKEQIEKIYAAERIKQSIHQSILNGYYYANPVDTENTYINNVWYRKYSNAMKEFNRLMRQKGVGSDLPTSFLPRGQRRI